MPRCQTRRWPANCAGNSLVCTLLLKVTFFTLRGDAGANVLLSLSWLCEIIGTPLASGWFLFAGGLTGGSAAWAGMLTVVAMVGSNVVCGLYCVPILMPSFDLCTLIGGMVCQIQSIAVLRASACNVCNSINGVAPPGRVSAVLMLLNAAMMISTDEVVGISTFVGSQAMVSQMRSHWVSQIHIL